MDLKTVQKIKDFLFKHPGYLKKSAETLYYRLVDEIDPRFYYTVTFLLKIKEIQKEIRKLNTLIHSEKDKIQPKETKRLFLDIEVSPNLVYSWRIGNKINLSIDNIIKERAIICISYKFQGEDKVHTLAWKKGDDKELLQKFAKIMNTADEVIAHNGDAFDIKWIRGRCIYHNIPLNEKFNSVDTLKLAKRQFNFNSNKLTYISQYLGLGKKIDTDYNLWKRVLNNDSTALTEMMIYCEQDINLLEQVYNKLEKYSPMKKYKYVRR